MKRREIKKAFDTLMMVWETERGTDNLMGLSDDELDFFMVLQKEIHKLEREPSPENISQTAESILDELKSNSSEMVNFFINDLLDMRIEKIIQSSRELNLIDENKLTSSEKEFYKNVISAFKGYNKVRNVYSVMSESCHVERLAPEDEKPFCASESFQFTPVKISYTPIRALNNIPSLVGSDFLVYGPFKNEDLGLIPKSNALILEKEKLIEIINEL